MKNLYIGQKALNYINGTTPMPTTIAPTEAPTTTTTEDTIEAPTTTTTEDTTTTENPI